jgi:hypothetical protein
MSNKSSEFAAQGTDAHTLGEYKLKTLLGIAAENPIPNLKYYDEEMEECTTAYATFVMEELAKAKAMTADPIVIVEQRLDYSKYVPEGFGTGDSLIIADGTLSIIDLKYGNLIVDAQDNPQMMCYAIGAIEQFDGIYDIQKVKMAIFQPRRETISTYELTKEQLVSWAENTLKPTAEFAFKGEGEFVSGSWCRWCLAKNSCRARAEHNLALAKHEFKPPTLLSDDEIEDVLAKVDGLVLWTNDVKAYALEQALSGKNWSHFKLVNGRSTRKYTNDNDVVSVVIKAGYDPYDKKLLGITAMTKSLGKAKFDELLSDYIIKPPGKLTLVTNDDKRQAVTINNVNEEFNNLTEDQ